jgi:hypothetical protein
MLWWLLESAWELTTNGFFQASGSTVLKSPAAFNWSFSLARKILDMALAGAKKSIRAGCHFSSFLEKAPPGLWSRGRTKLDA